MLNASGVLKSQPSVLILTLFDIIRLDLLPNMGVLPTARARSIIACFRGTTPATNPG